MMQNSWRRALAPANPQRVDACKVRDRFMELLGLEAVPDEVDYAPAGVDAVHQKIRVQSFRYTNLLGETVPAVLCAPVDVPGPIPGVVCLPGTSASAEELAETDFGPDPQRGGRLVGWSQELARRGFATLSVTLMGCTARRTGEAAWTIRTKLLAPYGLSPVGLMADEGLRAARILQTVAGVDPQRLGITGFSLGGQMAWVGMACAPWIRAGASLCGSAGSMAHAIADGDPERHGTHFYLPHLLRSFDHSRIFAECIAPRPVLVLAPTQDEDMPRSGVDELAAALAPVYAAAGVPQAFRVLQPDSRHLFRPEFFEAAAGWLTQALG